MNTTRRVRRAPRLVTHTTFALLATILAGAAALAQTTQPASVEIDACGILVRDGGCVLFQGAGGAFVVPDAGGFQVGDAVRAVGTADRSCITICPSADGCLRGAVLYDPALLPCGTPVDVPFDPCSGLSGLLTAVAATGFWLTRARRRDVAL